MLARESEVKEGDYGRGPQSPAIRIGSKRCRLEVGSQTIRDNYQRQIFDRLTSEEQEGGR